MMPGLFPPMPQQPQQPAGVQQMTPNTNPLGVARGGNDYAGRSYEALTRSMWDSYVANFMPYEAKLIEYATDPTVVSTAMADASQDVTNSFEAQRGATDRRLRGLGLSLDADEQKAADRSYGLAKSIADVTAQNVAGRRTRERQQSILGNPAPQG